MKTTNRVIVSLNALFWIIVLWFPFARFFSIPMMHTLSNYAVGGVLIFFMAVIVMAVLLYRHPRNKPDDRKADFVLAFFAVFANIALLTALNKGFL
jgi:hypothetical protein